MLDSTPQFERLLGCPLIKPHILCVVLAGRAVTIAVLVANTRLLVFLLTPVIYTFVTISAFQLSFGNTLMTTSITLQPTTASGNERIYITLPGSANLTEPNQAQSMTGILPTSPTLSLEGNLSQWSHQSYQTMPETPQRRLHYTKVSSRQILNIDKALQGDYTAIET